MDRSGTVTLINHTYTIDAYGVQHEAITTRQVFAQVESVSLSEWTEGGRMGLNPEYRFTLFSPEYRGEKELVYKDITYTVYRTYNARNDAIELYAERKQGNNEH